MSVMFVCPGVGMSVEHETADADWWEGALEEDSTWTLPLDGEGGLFTSGFLPPPPRPPFLEDVTPDGLTTCDLCAWASGPQPGPHTLDSSSGNDLVFGPSDLACIRGLTSDYCFGYLVCKENVC